MKPLRPVPLLILASLLAPLAAPLAAADFPPITDEERALTSVPGEPNAPAVVLFKKGEFLMMGYGLLTGSLASHLKVQVRFKVLTEQGKSSGEITVAHSDFTRLQNFEGRTVLPDGRVVPVSADAKFVRKTSRSKKTSVTAMAFPAVEVGAILDYQYELVFKSPFLLEPWFFSEDVPVRYSEVVFKTAPDWKMQIWTRALLGVKIRQETQQGARGYVLRAWAENLPAVPDDPYGPPYADLASQILLLPASRFIARQYVPLLENWQKVSEIFDKVYDEVRHRDDGVAQRARGIAASGTPREKAAALYRFVRDEIDTEPGEGVWVDPEASLGKVLSERRGEPAEKALLLEAMLKAVQVDAYLVWAGDRNRTTIDPKLPNPNWFDRVLVVVVLDGKLVYLDPSDRALGFGQIRATYERTPALIPRVGKPTGIVLPETSFDQNGRRAEIDLALDAQGRLSGQGSLLLTGHHAQEKIDRQESEAQRVQAWKDWLSGRFRDFQISNVKAVEAPDERKVTVNWSMAQREEEVLGDEVSLTPSAPLGPMVQPLVEPSSSRKTAVMFDFADREEVELRLRWPEGWKIESLPAPALVQSEVGALATTVLLKESERSLIYRRRLDVTRTTLGSKEEYEMAQSLFAVAEKNDARTLLLVHP